MVDEPTVSAEGDGRDGKGRFSQGNRHGRGNVALRRQGELQQAVREALTPEDLRAVLIALHSAAIKGDSQAASVLLAHCVGRPREAAPLVDVELPADLTTASGICAALQSIVHAAAAGDVPVDVAEALASLLGTVSDASVLRDIDERLRAIEARRQ